MFAHWRIEMMKPSLRLLLAAVMVALCASPVFAQMRSVAQAPVGGGAAAAGQEVAIRLRGEPKIDQRVQTPIYQSNAGRGQSANKPWLKISVEYETQNEWVDELEFTYFVLIRNQQGDRAYRKTVTYVDIKKGKHISDIYMRPNTFERLKASLVHAAVVVKAKGVAGMRVIAQESTLKQANWWEQIPSAEGTLLHRGETPFAFIEFDSYELIKLDAPQSR